MNTNKKVRVTVFDDVADYLTGMKKVLSNAGYAVCAILVREGDTPKSVAGKILRSKPDIVLADEQLPGFSGIDVLEASGKKFFAPNNPRVVSISVDSNVRKIAGGGFQWKKGLVSGSEFSRQISQEAFLVVVSKAVKKIAA